VRSFICRPTGARAVYFFTFFNFSLVQFQNLPCWLICFYSGKKSIKYQSVRRLLQERLYGNKKNQTETDLHSLIANSLESPLYQGAAAGLRAMVSNLHRSTITRSCLGCTSRPNERYTAFRTCRTPHGTPRTIRFTCPYLCCESFSLGIILSGQTPYLLTQMLEI